MIKPTTILYKVIILSHNCRQFTPVGYKTSMSINNTFVRDVVRLLAEQKHYQHLL
jgi:hypothetical protein